MLRKKIMVLVASAVMSLSMAMVSMAAIEYVSEGQGWKFYSRDGSVTDMPNTRWEQDQNGRKFISEGTPLNYTMCAIDGKLYLFYDGYMKIGWFQGDYGSLNPVTGESKDKLSGDWYYFGTDGAGATGWQQIDGKWYYFGPDSIMYRSETTPDGYYVDGNGECTEEGQKLMEELNAIDAASEAEEAKTPEEKVQEAIDITNEEREKRGLQPLIRNEELMEAAAIRAEELTESFSHTRPNGTRCSSILSENGIQYNGWAGENISSLASNAAGAVEGWMRSEDHKKNILNKNFTEIGVGYTESGGWVQILIGN